jgi:hypothetical protein
MIGRLEVRREGDALLEELAARALDDAGQEDVQVEGGAVERHLSARDAGQVEEVVDQAGLELHVAADHRQRVGHPGPRSLRRSSRCTDAITGVSGVRSSWDSVARKPVLAALASSARCRASAISRLCGAAR